MPHILVAEDDAFMQKLYRMTFDYEKDLDVTIVDKDWSKLPDCKGWPQVDVVLVDQYLEHYRGSELLQFLEATHPHVRRLMFTGDLSITEEQAHAHRVIHKPAGPRDIVEAVRDQLKISASG